MNSVMQADKRLMPEEAQPWRATGWQGKLRLASLRPKGTSSEVEAGLSPLGWAVLSPASPEGLNDASALGGPDEPPLTYLGGAEGKLIGYHSPAYFHLLPSVSYNTVAKFARDEGRHFGTKAHMLWKAMVE